MNTLNGERATAGHYRDLTLGVLLALALGLGVAMLLEVRSPAASAFDIKIALGCLVLAVLCALATPHKVHVLAIACGVIAAYALSSLLIGLIAARSPIARIAEVGLGASILYLDPPALHKRHYGFTLAVGLILHGVYYLFNGWTSH
ncbi:MAG: hypothetical protein WAM04_21725 [Candidatus Sulfotelmatobacter sp.]